MLRADTADTYDVTVGPATVESIPRTPIEERRRIEALALSLSAAGLVLQAADSEAVQRAIEKVDA